MNIDEIMTLARSVTTKHRVAETIYRMPQDYWHLLNVSKLITGAAKGEQWFDHVTFLCAFTQIEKPNNYLEVGIRKGGSMAQVLRESPGTQCWGFDMWNPDYCRVEGWNDPPGTAAIAKEALKQWNPQHDLLFTEGNSRDTLPKFFAEHPTYMCDLALVDGDHTEEGAKFDLDQVLPHAKVIVFDDITHPYHGYLDKVFDEAIVKTGLEWTVIKDITFVGTAVGFRK